MHVKEIIAERTADVIFVRQEDTVQTVAQILKTNNIGCVPVNNGAGDLVGILSERDVARSFVTITGRLRELTVAELMTKNVITCNVEDDLRSVMEKMSRHHIRHLPVMDDGKLVAMISSRDVLKAVLSEVTMERNVLRDIAMVSR